jgi:molecular chaperone GrpE
MDEREPQTPDTETTSESQEAPATETLTLEEQVQKLEEEKKRLEVERKSLFDQLMRRQADFENFRKRLEREKQEFRQAAQGNLVTQILPVLDTFERALAAGGSGSNQDYRKGVELIHKQLLDILAVTGLEPVKTIGQPFDPLIHHAVERVETTEHPDHEVVAELQRGYTFRQRLLRPAQVRVAVHPTPSEEKEPRS